MFTRRIKVMMLLFTCLCIAGIRVLYLQIQPTRRLPENNTSRLHNLRVFDRDHSLKLDEQVYKSAVDTTTNNLKPCKVDTEVRGVIAVNQSSGLNFTKLEYELPYVNHGGWWTPVNCYPNITVGIVIPFRDRDEHLHVFLRHMHPFLARQRIRYRIYVIEQADLEQPFNRGMLMNVGYISASKIFGEHHDCFIFHDVDLIPEHDRNDYHCPTSPRHMSVAVSTMGYRIQYADLFGGVEAFWKKHFESINGFPNRFWGWGAEDDDLFQRITRKDLVLTRPNYKVGRYTMLKHKKQKKPKNKFYNLKISAEVNAVDGLNTLDYQILLAEERPLYSFVSVNLHFRNISQLIPNASKIEKTRNSRKV